MSERRRCLSWFLCGTSLAIGLDAAGEGRISLAAVTLFLVVANAIFGCWSWPENPNRH